MVTESGGNRKQGRKVLLVDDEQMVLEVGKAILERLGHDVLVAESGEEALDQFAEHKNSIGCVVLDLTMPGIDGKAAFHTLRELDQRVPIIIASGLSVDQVLCQFDETPPTSIIQKPYQIADLSRKIQDIFDEEK